MSAVVSILITESENQTFCYKSHVVSKCYDIPLHRDSRIYLHLSTDCFMKNFLESTGSDGMDNIKQSVGKCK